VGPFVSNKKLIKLRQEIFSLINPAILLLVILSTIALFLRLSFAFGYSGFFGMFNHSMFLGPMASISCLYSITKYHTSKNTLFLVAGIFSMVTCIAAGSRAALGGLFIGILYLIFILYKRKLSTYFKVVLSIFLLIILSKP